VNVSEKAVRGRLGRCNDDRENALLLLQCFQRANWGFASVKRGHGQGRYRVEQNLFGGELVFAAD